MAVLDDLGDIVDSRINRVNPGSGLFAAPADSSQDWTRNSLDQYEAAARQRQLDEEERRRREEEDQRQRAQAQADNQRADFTRREDDRAATQRSRVLVDEQRSADERKKYIDDAEGQNFGNSSIKSRGQAGVLRYSQSAEGLKTGGSNRLLRPVNAAMRVAANKDGWDFDAVGQSLTDSVRRDASARYDPIQLLKTQVRGTPDDVKQGYARELAHLTGRGQEFSDWRAVLKKLDTDPLSVFAADPRISSLDNETLGIGTTGPMQWHESIQTPATKALIAQARGLQAPAADATYEDKNAFFHQEKAVRAAVGQNQSGFFSDKLGDMARGAVPGAVGNMLGGLAEGIAQPVESTAAAAAAIPLRLQAATVGRFNHDQRDAATAAANKLDSESGNAAHFQSAGEAARYAVNTGIGVAALFLPGEALGNGVMRLTLPVAERLGMDAASPVVRAALGEAIKPFAKMVETVALNAGSAVAISYTSARVSGASHDEALKSAIETAKFAGAASLVQPALGAGVGRFSEGLRTAGDAAAKVPGGRAVVQAGLAGSATYAAARATGHDNEEALRAAATAAAATGVGRFAKDATGAVGARLGMVENLPERGAAERGIPSVEFHPVTDPKVFEAAKSANSRAWNLSPHSAEEFAASKAFLSPDGKTGYMLSPEGDIQNLFNNGGPPKAGQAAFLHAIENGGKTLDAYAGDGNFLPKLYAKFGFKPTEAMKFADEYAPAGWDYTADGRPDIIFMRYEGGDPATLHERIGTFAPYEHPGKYTTDWDAAKQLTRESPHDTGVGGGARTGLGDPAPDLTGQRMAEGGSIGVDNPGRGLGHDAPTNNGWDVSPDEVAFGRSPDLPPRVEGTSIPQGQAASGIDQLDVNWQFLQDRIRKLQEAVSYPESSTAKELGFDIDWEDAQNSGPKTRALREALANARDDLRYTEARMRQRGPATGLIPEPQVSGYSVSALLDTSRHRQVLLSALPRELRDKLLRTISNGQDVPSGTAVPYLHMGSTSSKITKNVFTDATGRKVTLVEIPPGASTGFDDYLVGLRDARTGGTTPVAAGLTEGTGSQLQDPATRAALQAGGAAVYGYATADGDQSDKLKQAAEYGLASGLRSGAGARLLEHVSGKVAATGKYIADPASSDAELGKAFGIEPPQASREAGLADAFKESQQSAEKLSAMLEPVKDTKAEAADRMKKVNDKRMAAVSARKVEAMATPEQVTAVKAQSSDYLAHAESAMEDPHYMNQLLQQVPGLAPVIHAVNSIIDPSSNKVTFMAKKVAAATMASADYLRSAAGTQSIRASKLLDELAPIVGKENHLQNAAKQIAAGATPVAAGWVGGELTGDDRLKELGIIAGAGALGATSGFQAKAKWANRPWENIRYHGLADDRRLPEQLRSGPGKLYDILQNPERYDLSAAQSTAVEAYQSAHNEMVRQTNAALQASGSDTIPFLEQHGILQFFTEDSVRRVFGEDAAKAFRMQTPGFDRLRSPQMLRDLGPTYESALRAQPGLDIIKDPMALLRLEVKRHDQIRANAMLVQNLKESGGAWKIPSDAERQALSKQDRLDLKVKQKGMEQRGWRQLPGIDDHLFHPEMVKAVDSLLIPTRGNETGPLAVADGITNILRQAMFTGDLSAWTMQGAMLAINDPMGAVRNFIPLVGASFGGKRYFDHWVSKNQDLWNAYTKAGGIGGLEHEGIEKEGKLSLSNMPGVKQIEQHGFEAYLPIHRALQWDLQRQTENFIKGFGPAKGKFPVGGRLAAEFLKNGPLLAGAGIAASGVDIPGVDDQYEAGFALALGLATNVGTRAAFKAEARYAGEKLSKAENIKSSVQAAKQINRTSGTLNRQLYGISAQQSQWERTIGARSPALLRNTFILAKKASTDFGPEGAMARYYLVKTAVLMGAGMAAMQYLATGSMPSMNPMDEDSILNPKSQNFLKAQGGATGTLSASNPVIGLVKALMRTDSPDGVRKWRMQDWVPMVGLADWYSSRTPDVIGAATRPLATEIGNGLQSHLSDAGIGAPGNSTGFNNGLFQPPLPLTAKAAFNTGVIQNHTAIGKFIKPLTDNVGLKEDPNYSNPRERAAGLFSNFVGLNHNPETLGREMTRIKAEEVSKQFPGLQDRANVNGNKDGVVDYNDLNSGEQTGIRGALDKNTRYAELKKTLADNATGQDSPVQSYFNRLDGINKGYTTKMQDLDTRYKSGKTSAFDAKAEYQFLAGQRRQEITDAQTDLGKLAAQRKGTDETVLDYLGRYMKPEDKVVNDWYALFDQATGKDGKLDFNKLDALQTAFKAKTAPEYAKYLDERLASFDKPKDTQFGRDYDAAKAATKPYYDAADTAFEYVKGLGVFDGFNTYSEFETAVRDAAQQRGIPVQNMLDSLSSDPAMKAFQKLLSGQRTLLRLDNPAMDSSLQKFYNKAPVKGTMAYYENKYNKLQMASEPLFDYSSSKTR
jgi:hypothetical protein